MIVQTKQMESIHPLMTVQNGMFVQWAFPMCTIALEASGMILILKCALYRAKLTAMQKGNMTVQREMESILHPMTVQSGMFVQMEFRKCLNAQETFGMTQI